MKREQLENLLNFSNQKNAPKAESKEELLKRLENSVKQSKPLNSSKYRYLEKRDEIPVDKDGAIYIEPEKAFCLATRNQQNGEKIFINVTIHEAIDSPEETEILQDNSPAAGFRVPMSVLPPYNDPSEITCIMIDCCINPSVYHKLKENQFNNDNTGFFTDLLFNYLIQKYNIHCDKRYGNIEEAPYKGSYIQFHRIRYKKKPKIKMMDEKRSKEYKTETRVPETKPNTQQILTPEFNIILVFSDNIEEEYNGINWDDDVIGIGFDVHFPLLSDVSFVNVTANSEEISFIHKFYVLHLRFPNIINENTLTMTKTEDGKTLQIRAEFYQDKKEEIEESQVKEKAPKLTMESDLLDDIM